MLKYKDISKIIRKRLLCDVLSIFESNKQEQRMRNICNKQFLYNLVYNVNEIILDESFSNKINTTSMIQD